MTDSIRDFPEMAIYFPNRESYDDWLDKALEQYERYEADKHCSVCKTECSKDGQCPYDEEEPCPCFTLMDFESWLDMHNEVKQMQSNLPAGCSDRDLPANRPEDLAIEQAIEKKLCEACKHFFINSMDAENYCEVCMSTDCNNFTEEPDHAKILERLNDRAES